ncbi:MAG: hypothetical protein ACKN81_14520, partial [Pirellulaceae bacterium]
VAFDGEMSSSSLDMTASPCAKARIGLGVFMPVAWPSLPCDLHISGSHHRQMVDVFVPRPERL